MPNHCSNQLTATGLTPSAGQALRDAFTNKNFPNAFVPEPDWKLVPFEDGRMPAMIKEEDGEERVYTPEGQRDKRWYNWRKENWGTKWGAYDAVIEDDETNEENGRLVVKYLTAWAPLNEDCFEALSASFPGVLFRNDYCEEGVGFLGVTLAQDSIVIESTMDLEKLHDRWQATNTHKLFEVEQEHGDDEDAFGEALWNAWHEDMYGLVSQTQEDIASDLEEVLSIKAKQVRAIPANDREETFTEFYEKLLREKGLETP